MNAEYLDLRLQRCPMALLLAKRAAMQLAIDQSLTILSHDLVSIRDMAGFFSQPPFTVKLNTDANVTTLYVTKRNTL
ncbi:sulfurtransferase TusA family protein [Vibrio hibernica]|uniref:sulfurtransferase TusA family protein n=1 Tax=Vibrio hibernica TaxID=2587465 RepID=UPI0018800E9F|nr:sulfurtransferase TusA family protein [Vibrio hibernica]